MLRLQDPSRHGHVGAALDSSGEPYKIVCDVLVVTCYVVDCDTMPMPSITVTFARVDSSRDFARSGPLVQHLITGHELIEILEDLPITIESIEASVLGTGIPTAYIAPEDLAVDPSLPSWMNQTIIARMRDTLAKLKAQREGGA
jgi:hypothetical protein